MPKTKLEIIRETVEFYAADPKGRRAVADNGGGLCQYLTSDGRMCAIGRCLIAPGDMLNSDVAEFNDIDYLLRQEYCGHFIAFWEDLQHFHDQDDNWSDSGLTVEGKAYLASLEVTYANS